MAERGVASLPMFLDLSGRRGFVLEKSDQRNVMGARRGARGPRGGRHARDVLEVVHEVRLVVVARVPGDLGPRGATFRVFERAAEAQDATQLLRSDADLTPEELHEAPVAELSIAPDRADLPARGFAAEAGQRLRDRRMGRKTLRDSREHRPFEELQLSGSVADVEQSFAKRARGASSDSTG